ncbi:MAG: thioredoxin family protein [Planctomycetota bacterium]|nr:thioredoxin family protein [Planctomycetota bacterium]
MSQANVIQASRRFVCIRLATYEDAEEAKILKSVFTGRSGELENTVFSILSPDGKRGLVRSGRSPQFAFSGAPQFAARQMASSMNRIAEQYQAKAGSNNNSELPKLKDFRLGLNVAACDNQPLVVVVGNDAATTAKLERQLAAFAWSDEFIGQFIYAATSKPADLKQALKQKAEIKAGYLVIQPGRFGMTGEILSEIPQDTAAADLRDALNLSVVLHQKFAKQTRTHIAEGRRSGVDWKTAIPVTDPGIPAGGRRRPQ